MAARVLGVNLARVRIPAARQLHSYDILESMDYEPKNLGVGGYQNDKDEKPEYKFSVYLSITYFLLWSFLVPIHLKAYSELLNAIFFSLLLSIPVIISLFITSRLINKSKWLIFIIAIITTIVLSSFSINLLFATQGFNFLPEAFLLYLIIAIPYILIFNLIFSIVGSILLLRLHRVTKIFKIFLLILLISFLIFNGFKFNATRQNIKEEKARAENFKQFGEHDIAISFQAKQNRDVNLCNQITYLESKDNCILNVAIDRAVRERNPSLVSLCDQISSKKIKNTCINLISEINSRN